MEPLVERLEDEEKVKVARLEVWHSEANAKLMREFDKGFCGGVPSFSTRSQGNGSAAGLITNA